MPDPQEILDAALEEATGLGANSFIADGAITERIEFVCRCRANRSAARLILSCMLAKIHQPDIDPRKPYTRIGSDDAFSGRTYDEQYLSHFISVHRLPCNSTTVFLTPALRNRNMALTIGLDLVGRPPEVYEKTLQTLDDVANARVPAAQVLTETIRVLILIRDEKLARIMTLLRELRRDEGILPLSSEGIVNLLSQHLACRNSSRLSVLIVAAAYQAVSGQLGEEAKVLQGHLSADEQSGATGDVEICMANDDRVVTTYEMKARRVTRSDIDRALQKIAGLEPPVDNYIFITTDRIDEDVCEYARTIYEQTNGTELVILDCIGFIRHFLHLFHRLRIEFIDAYQELVLAEPDSAVNQPLKESLLTLRQAAESEE